VPDGTVVERGGEFIAPKDAAIRGLCAELGLELVPHGFSFDRRQSPDGSRPTAAEVEAVDGAAARVASERLASGEADFPLADAFALALDGDPRRSPVYRRLATSTTVPLERVSARWFCSDAGHGYDDAVHVRGGNQLVCVELAARLREPVQTGTPVAAVSAAAGGVEVTDADGAAHAADAAIVAVPLPLLRELTFEPSLPGPLRDAIAHTLFGDAKLHLELAAAVPARGVASDGALWWTWNSLGSSALSAFAGGADAIEALAVGDGPERWAREAAALRPDVEPAASALLTHWGAERWTQGSYSAPAVGWLPEHDGAWAQAGDRVALTGEHTAGPLAASMNGAVHLGARAAERVTHLTNVT
jgi:monoamine oxidase